MASLNDASNTPSDESSKYVYNKAYGHDGGGEFLELSEDKSDYVRQLKVYTRVGPGGHTMIKCVEVWWKNGNHAEIGEKHGDGEILVFGPEDRITRMIIYTGDWVDSISIKTTRQPDKWWHAGGPGGNQREQDVGSGLLAGFQGRKGRDVDMLGSIFWK